MPPLARPLSKGQFTENHRTTTSTMMIEMAHSCRGIRPAVCRGTCLALEAVRGVKRGSIGSADIQTREEWCGKMQVASPSDQVAANKRTFKVPLQSSLVLCTLARAHYRSIDEFPDPEGDRPFGALILAVQLVESSCFTIL